MIYAAYMNLSEHHSDPRNLSGGTCKGHSEGNVIKLVTPSNSLSANAATISDHLMSLGTGAIKSPRSTTSAWLQQSILLNLSMQEYSHFYHNGFALSHCVIKSSSRVDLIEELMMLGINESSIFESSEALALSITQKHFMRTYFPPGL